MILKRNYILFNDTTFLLKMPSRVIVVYGDYEIGKSLVLSQIQDRAVLYPADYEDTIIINSLVGVELFLKSDYKDKIIIIDRYDYFKLKCPEICQKIMKLYNQNHFLLFANGITGVLVRNADYTELVYDEHLKQFKLFYRFLMPLRDDLKKK